MQDTTATAATTDGAAASAAGAGTADGGALAGLDLAPLAVAIDLDAAPYSSRFSRLLVLSADGRATWAGPAPTADGADAADGAGPEAGSEEPATQPLTVMRTAYERRVRNSLVVDGLRILDAAGRASSWEAGADGVRFATGARVLVTDDDHLVVAGLGAGQVLELRPLAVPAEHAEAVETATAALPVAERLRVEGTAEVEETDGLLRVRARGETAVSWAVTAGGGAGASTDGPAADGSAADGSATGASVAERVARHDRLLADWLGRAPMVAPARQAMADLCWWVLGNNTLHLTGEHLAGSTAGGDSGTAAEAGGAAGIDAAESGAGPRAVVPSKLGYVGLWQWDAYFIALGLRHGDPELAREQMAIALGHATEAGQLPDVVHDHGVLDSSENLPPGDLENLRRLASPTLLGGPVPLTKPPLTALTLDLLTAQLGQNVVEQHLETVLASQRWWFEASDPGATGWPAYLHPYSSGLDDSPVFDHNAILRSPDLAAYLIGQDHRLSTWLEARGRDEDAAACRERAARLCGLLEERWDVERELFVLPGENSDVTTRSILNLIALLIPGLREDIRDSLIAQVTDPARFGGTWLLPTVSRDDPDFSPERMWRGPIWVNTAWLVIRGLRVQGQDALADQVRENVLDLVQYAGGPSEYYNPDFGRKAGGATVLFGWSSALFVDMAVEAAAG